MSPTPKESVLIIAVTVFLLAAGFQNCGPAKISGNSQASTAADDSTNSPQQPGSEPAPAPQPVVSKDPVPIAACSATSSRPDAGCNFASDSNMGTAWNAGDNNASITFDLGSPQDLSRLSLFVNQSPEGVTKHNVYYGLSSDTPTLLTTFNEYTQSGSILKWQGATFQARYIRIETVQNPSWTSWWEVQFFH